MADGTVATAVRTTTVGADDAAAAVDADRLAVAAAGPAGRHAGRLRRVRPVGVRVPPGIAPVPLARLNIVVTCKGRLSHLRVTLPGFLHQLPLRGRVVVVDYGCPDGAFDHCVALADPRLLAVRVLDGTAAFNLSRARNCGANALAADAFCFVDADSLLHPEFVDQAVLPLRWGRAVLTKRNWRDRQWHTCGLCCVTADAYRRARGYDEAFRGWGPEDWDFYARVGRVGPVHSFPPHLYPTTLSHSNEDRTRFYEDKDMGLSAARGGGLMGDAGRLVNPHGYGRAEADVYGLDGPAVRRVSLCEPHGGLTTDATCDVGEPRSSAADRNESATS